MEMATILVREFDFREANVPEKMLALKIDAAGIEAGMNAAAERFLTIEAAADGIRAGDIVGLGFADGEEAWFSVGKGFFDREAEDALLGLRRGQEAEVKGRKAEIRSVKRRNIPALTDEAVASIGIEGAATIEGYRQYLIDRAVQRKRGERDHILMDFVSKQVIAQSEFTPVERDKDGYRVFYEGTLDKSKEFAAQEEASATEILRKMLNQPKESGEGAVLAALAEQSEYQAKLLALGWEHARRDGVTYTLEELGAQLRQTAEERGIPYEAFLDQAPLEERLAGQYISHYQQKILAHYEKQYTTVIA